MCPPASLWALKTHAPQGCGLTPGAVESQLPASKVGRILVCCGQTKVRVRRVYYSPTRRGKPLKGLCHPSDERGSSCSSAGVARATSHRGAAMIEYASAPARGAHSRRWAQLSGVAGKGGLITRSSA